MASFIELREIRKSYPMPGGDVHALKGVTLSFEPGEVVSVTGSSGSGKSTLLYVIGMLTEPSAGDYRFGDRELGTLSDVERSRLRGKEIGFVFQSFHLVPQLNIQKNVLLAARYAAANGANGADLPGRATALLERVGLGHRMHHRPIELSNGEMQRVAIARALLMEPSLILADEPTGNLDEENGNVIYELLESLGKDGHTVVIVTHDLQLADRTPRRVRLKDGEVVE